MRYNTTISLGDVPAEVVSMIGGGSNFTENNEDRDILVVKAFTYMHATVNLDTVCIISYSYI